MTDRDLIVNADDFGRCRLINAGIRRSHEEGIVTSASLMVRWEGAGEAAAYAREHRSLAVGLHLDLGEWAYRRSRWEATYEVVPLDDAAAVEREALSQLGAFRRLLGRYPTHIDSHQHVHGSDPVRSVAREIAGELNVPLRGEAGGIRYCGDFYGKTGEGEPLHEAVTPERLMEILIGLPPGPTELACHPGDGAETDPIYDEERRLEVAALCDPRVRGTLEELGVSLRSFAELDPG
ncbi:MAG TPA: ChbG/HpnK family deacetylase [Thermoleophilaceae bacterium]|nr:ChbG/HpnK family deacetylase [Thermoleophilaceae bacterium]